MSLIPQSVSDARLSGPRCTQQAHGCMRCGPTSESGTVALGSDTPQMDSVPVRCYGFWRILVTDFVMSTHPRAVGPYRILDTIGVGGMGVVYRGENTATGEIAAVKTVRVPMRAQLSGLRREIH